MMSGENGSPKWTMRRRVQAVLQDEPPDRMPFIDRIELWHQSRQRLGSLPGHLRELTLDQVHEEVGIGRQQFVTPYAHKLHGVELVCRFEGEIIFSASEPVVEYFPATWAPAYIPRDRAGDSFVEYTTSVGKLSTKYSVTESMLAMGELEPYLMEHLIKDDADYKTVEYILKRAEFVSKAEEFAQADMALGENGFAVPGLHRIPFQQALLEYLGEIPLFTALYENLNRLERLLEVLDEWITDLLHRLSGLPVIYVEFGDNLDGMMTNPDLFATYCLPFYQKYAELLHGQGKKVGSHTDGNLKPLVGLLAESGLDVCESFSPDPLTPCRFAEAWEAWKGGPMIWGGIPSTILQADTSDDDFEKQVGETIAMVGDRPIIWGVGDMVMGNNLIKRVSRIAEMIEGKDSG